MKIFKIIPILIFTFLLLGAVYSSDIDTISFEGVNFHIMDDFKDSGKIRDYDGLGSDGKTCLYTNNESEKIEITVISDWMGISLDDFKRDGASKKTINGHKGWSYKQNDLSYFGYVSGDEGILVGVTNSSYLYDIII